MESSGLERERKEEAEKVERRSDGNEGCVICAVNDTY